ncbi:MAG: hypothetical protein ACE5HP_11605 [Gemmatimonadota bacterium]
MTRRLAPDSVKWAGLAFLAAWASELTGCGSQTSGAGGPVVRDSAGVEIVENLDLRWNAEEGWSVDPVPELDLATSGRGAPHEFDRVTDATRLRDGTVAVADYTSREVRLFSASGEFLRRVGREGEGPGDFQRLRSVDRYRGDSVVVYDHSLSRVTVLSPEWEAARFISLREIADRVPELYPVTDSTFVSFVFSYSSIRDVLGYYRIPVAVVRLSAIGTVLDTLAVVPGWDGFSVPRGDLRPLFSRSAHMDVGRGQFVIGTADRMEYQQFSADGALVRIVRVPEYDLSLSSSDVERERQALMPEDLPAVIRVAVERMPPPTSRPAYSDLLLDSEGYVWAAVYHALFELDLPTEWQVFDPQGVWLGAVQFPSRFDAFQIGRDYVLGRLRDDLDVEHVQVLRLHRR